MSSNSVSNAAAMAAFKALGQKKENDFSRYNKIPTKTTKYVNKASVPHIQTKKSPLLRPTTTLAKPVEPKQSSKPSLLQQSMTDPSTPTTPAEETEQFVYNPHTFYQGNPSSQSNISTKSHTNISTSSSVVENQGDNSSISIHKPMKKLTVSQLNKQSQSSLPREMIKNVKQSIESKTISNDQSSKRISTQYEPQEMIKHIKHSINSKRPNQSPSDVQAKNHMLDEIRSSIDLKRISTPISRHDDVDEIHSLLSWTHDNSTDQLLKSSFAKDLNYSSEDCTKPIFSNSYENIEIPGYNASINKSYSSLGSNPSDAEHTELRQKPTIVLTDHDTLNVTRHVSPIAIPPSPNAFARKIDTNSADSFLFTSRRDQGSLSEHSVLYTPEERIKPGRKPPPKMDYFMSASELSFIDRNNDTSSLRSLLVGNEDCDTDFEDMKSASSSTKSANTNQDNLFPQYPDVKLNSSKVLRKIGGSIFKSSNNVNQKGVDNLVNLLGLDEDSDRDIREEPEMSNEYAAANAIITHQNQPVKLKTTMRKTNRKKKKLLFNENKPWKNHRDLNYLTEQERRRYEGLWVSNRGSYVDSVVVKLAGVNYDKEQNSKLNEEEETSLRAARLSSKVMSGYDDRENLHNLKSASIDQLIHGVVVKRIWKRSRLPNQTLKLIWNLVDFRKDGTLNKVEFLVGMWLIDQCLYGRKLPKKVEDSVWESISSIGVNVVIKSKGKR
jgi:hypothetical protein